MFFIQSLLMRVTGFVYLGEAKRRASCELLGNPNWTSENEPITSDTLQEVVVGVSSEARNTRTNIMEAFFKPSFGKSPSC
jgi:hypothetical protein